MKIVIAPDSFKESMTAVEVTAAMVRGVHRVLPTATCIGVPMADGGEGTTKTMVSALGGQLIDVTVRDALGRPALGQIGVIDEQTVVIESASAVGLAMIAPADRDVMAATSIGVADLVRAALDYGVERIVIGVGGTATNDGGAGLLVGLGARLVGHTRTIDSTPTSLAGVTALDLTGLDPRLTEVQLDLMTDVSNPLVGPQGASAVFGEQKGASVEQVKELDAVLTRFADVLEAAAGRAIRALPGAGAGGGLGAAFLALGATARQGVDVVAEISGLATHIADADLVLTGEGRLDSQTARGKVPAGVTKLARAAGVPVVAFAGQVEPDLPDIGFSAVVPVMRRFGDREQTFADGPVNVEEAVATAIRLITLI